MTDYPAGEWSEILVGHVWPAASNLAILGSASTQFGRTSAQYHHFHDVLDEARHGPLANQEGRTAEDLRSVFLHGEGQAREIAEKNDVKKTACDSSYGSANDLRSELTTIAHRGNDQIALVQNSKEPAMVKIVRITQIIFECQSEANTRAAACSQNILSSVQRVLDREGIGISAFQFAQNHGVGVNRAFGSPNTDAIRDRVAAILNNSKAPSPDTSAPRSTLFGQGAATGPATEQPSPTQTHQLAVSPDAFGQGGATRAWGDSARLAPGIRAPSGLTAFGQGGVTTRPTGFSGAAGGAIVQPTNLPGGHRPPLPSLGSSGAAGSASVSPGLTPSELMQSFDHGMQTGGPMSAATSALSHGPMNAVEPQLQPSTPHITETPVASTLPSNAHVPVVDAPHPTHAPAAASVPPPSVPQSDMATTYVAGPIGPAAAPAPAAPAPTALPSYGADIRPLTSTASVISTAPAGSTPITPATAPTSSPAGASGLSQSALVRQTGTPATVPHAPAGVTEQAVAAAGSGAATGAASAAATARARLQRLAEAVARQQPRLRWAAGDRADGTTVLVTDLASGWIPPGIDVPVGVKLLEPAHRRGDLEALLGDVTVTANYTPVHYLPPVQDVEDIAVSTRARQVPAIDELGWELVQATRWRDELPRLAHTLAKAASTGTGVLDSEIDLLHEHLTEVRKQVLDSYPEHVSGNLVGNWQLLATIDALVDGDKTTANYHFAWFRALSQATLHGGIR